MDRGNGPHIGTIGFIKNRKQQSRVQVVQLISVLESCRMRGTVRTRLSDPFMHTHHEEPTKEVYKFMLLIQFLCFVLKWFKWFVIWAHCKLVLV